MVHVMPVQLYRNGIEDNGVFVNDLNLRRIVLQPALSKAVLVCQVCRVRLSLRRIQVEFVTWCGHRPGIALDMAVVAGEWLVIEGDYGMVGEDSIGKRCCVRAVVNACREHWSE